MCGRFDKRRKLNQKGKEIPKKMADVFDLELEDKQLDSDDDIIEVDDVSFYFRFFSLILLNYFLFILI